MPRKLHLIAALGALLSLIVLSSCYTLGTEPEWVRGPISDQPQSLRRASVIPAELFMEQYKQFQSDSAYGQQSYRIAVGIRLDVDVIGQGVAKSVHVGPDGQIDLPYVGTVKAAGKYLDELRDDLKELYTPFFKGDFQVNVNTTRPIAVLGNDLLYLSGRATLIVADDSLRGGTVELQGDELLTEVIFSRHGGIGNIGEKPEWKEIGIIREVTMDEEAGEKETIIILCDLEKLLFGGDMRQNVPIRNKDIVFVPRRRDSLIEELHESMGYWASFMSNVQRIRNVVKAMESW